MSFLLCLQNLYLNGKNVAIFSGSRNIFQRKLMAAEKF